MSETCTQDNPDLVIKTHAVMLQEDVDRATHVDATCGMSETKGMTPQIWLIELVVRDNTGISNETTRLTIHETGIETC